MTEIAQAYPLQWPMGWRRCDPKKRTAARFRGVGQSGMPQRLTIPQGISRVRLELYRFAIRAEDVVISTNLETHRTTGLPSSRARAPEDPGVAVFWRYIKDGKSVTRCMAIDVYTTVADNLAAVAATLHATRAIERHGGAQILDRVFEGFLALPAPEQWFSILGVGAHATREEIESAYSRLASKYHPDRPDGDAAMMTRVNTARDEAIAMLGDTSA